ncbi:AAA family ATPase [Vibrio fluvialis]|uniref:McrB family protein n=2 Tax=Vibrio TaxID=662 RepID=UPI0018F16F81|nr:AAA family ATPase [Vibrio sp. bablab_jr001]EKO3401268.1 AAA family ATPase [Vibrio fluvialis]MBY8118124.1 AAA family ATPase [Vibrio fluvialis]MBY8250638.1 AAA family ATPase [Vibrio fluvialis]MBY8284204.1 AAA family ATPase [Vibrio fluvialis]
MTWPMSDRDTTEFPEFDIQINSDLRSHLQDILNIPSGTLSTDYDEIRKHSYSGKADSRIRTYRKLYERLGLVFIRDHKIEHSKLSNDIGNLENSIKSFAESKLKEASSSVVKILSRYQYNNPIDSKKKSMSVPNVHPYFLLWKAMRSLGNKIHFEEVNRVLIKVESDDEIDEAIDKIRTAREVLQDDYTNTKTLDSELGSSIITDQTSARIAPLFSIAGWGGLLIERTQDSNGFRNLCSHAINAIDHVLLNPPSFYNTDNEDDWISYYFADLTMDEEGYKDYENFKVDLDAADLDDICSRIKSLGGHYEKSTVEEFHLGLTFHPDKHFVLIKGPSGTGKTLLVRAYSRAVSKIDSLKDKHPLLFICPVRPNWTDPSQVMGYFDVMSNQYIVPPVLNAILTAYENPRCPVFVCLDELNLARVEHYFSDILSAMESREEFELHSRGEGVISPEGKVIPEKIILPSNLYLIGTINVDESTTPISDKVLDRAVVIDLQANNTEEFLIFLAQKISSLKDTINELKIFVCTLTDILNKGNNRLTNRVIEETMLYMDKVKSKKGVDYNSQLDRVIKSRIIEKLKGDESSREMLEELSSFFENNSLSIQLPLCKDFIGYLQNQLDDFGAYKAFR